MSEVQKIPVGYHTITPTIFVKGAAQAMEFYKQAFGAEEICRHAMPDGKIMPFCSYNTLHRPRYMHKTPTRAQNQDAAALPSPGADGTVDGVGAAHMPSGRP